MRNHTSALSQVVEENERLDVLIEPQPKEMLAGAL